jgi:hypothetical protein
MAAPSYTEDLTDIATGDEDGTWTSFSTNEQGSASYLDADYPYIQGSFAVTQTCSKSKTLANLGFDYGQTINLPTDGAFLVWQLFASPFAIDDYAGTVTTYGGMHVLIGGDISNFGWWDVGGNDKAPNPYGGFQCHAVNTTVSFDRETGTYATDQVVGAGLALKAYPSKGEPHSVDAMRFGRCSAIFEEGDIGNGYATINGFALVNDNQLNRWGLIQETAGGYLWQGRMLLGTGASAVDFIDSDVNIFIKWTPKVTENFNTIEIQNINSNIEMTGFTIQVLDITTASRGKFLMSDPADVTIDQCTFVDMDTFVFDSTTDVNTVSITDTTFKRCGEITQGGAIFDGCSFINSDSTTTMQVDNLNNIDNCVFESDGSNHAMELDDNHAGLSFTLIGCTYENYAGSDGDTGNEVIYNNSGGHVTINISDGDVPTIRNGSGSTTNVIASVVWTFQIKNSNNEFVTGVEFRIYNSGTTTQVYGVENSATGTEVYSFDQSLAGSNVDIVVMDVPDYLYFRQTLLRPSGSQTSTLVLTDDRWYV